MAPSGLALGINKQTWKKKMTVTIILLQKVGQGEKKKKKNGAGTRLIPVQRAFVSSAQAENYVWI